MRVSSLTTPHCTCILILTCYQCDKAFPTQKLLDYHNKCHEARKVRQDVEQDIIFKCHKCGLDFSGKINLRQHLRQHLEFKCESCYRFYPTQEQLDKHVLNHKIYRCDECDVSFTVKHKYNKHMKAFKHGGMKNFQCDKCDKSYSTMQHLGVHYVSKIYISEFIYTPVYHVNLLCLFSDCITHLGAQLSLFSVRKKILFKGPPGSAYANSHGRTPLRM